MEIVDPIDLLQLKVYHVLHARPSVNHPSKLLPNAALNGVSLESALGNRLEEDMACHPSRQELAVWRRLEGTRRGVIRRGGPRRGVIRRGGTRALIAPVAPKHG